MGDAQNMLEWEGAAARIVEAVRARGARGALPVVGITGPAGAGKSTLAGLVAGHAGGVVVSTDDYLPDYERVPEAERDLPEHADLPLLVEHLHALRSGKAAEVPVWSFHEHKRVDVRLVQPPGVGSTGGGAGAGLIVVEGLFALHERLGDVVDLRVFVEAPAEVRWARWEAIEQRGERGMGVEAARAFFHEVADPTYARHAPVYRAAADLIVTNH